MTPDARQLITGLFDRMRSTSVSEKDRDAEFLINQSVRQIPDAAYKLVQSVLVQEHVLQQADQRIRDLEEQVRQLESQGRPAAASGSFLGGLFGGGRPSAQPAGGSVPPVGRQSPDFGSRPMGAPSAPWSQQPAQQQPGAGGGFLRTAMMTAAGVAGGVLLADSLRGMMGGSSAAHASTPAAEQPAPHEAQSHEAQSQEPQYQDPADNDPGATDASYDSGSGDWGGGGDDIDI